MEDDEGGGKIDAHPDAHFERNERKTWVIKALSMQKAEEKAKRKTPEKLGAEPLFGGFDLELLT